MIQSCKLTSITGVKYVLIDIHSQQQTRELSDENVQFDIDAIADNPEYSTVPGAS
jgi:DNA repair protein RecN (Recombination protein N)